MIGRGLLTPPWGCFGRRGSEPDLVGTTPPPVAMSHPTIKSMAAGERGFKDHPIGSPESTSSNGEKLPGEFFVAPLHRADSDAVTDLELEVTHSVLPLNEGDKEDGQAEACHAQREEVLEQDGIETHHG
jgi:hypothetical protein